MGGLGVKGAVWLATFLSSVSHFQEIVRQLRPPETVVGSCESFLYIPNCCGFDEHSYSSTSVSLASI